MTRRAPGTNTSGASLAPMFWSANRGLVTLVHFSAQLEPFLTRNAPSTPHNQPYYFLNTPVISPKCTLYPTESA